MSAEKDIHAIKAAAALLALQVYRGDQTKVDAVVHCVMAVNRLSESFAALAAVPDPTEPGAQTARKKFLAESFVYAAGLLGLLPNVPAGEPPREVVERITDALQDGEYFAA